MVMADVYEPPRLRASTACVACNKKKVRCIFSETSSKCRNCLRHQWPCFQREPKRRGRQPGYARRERRPGREQLAPLDAQLSPDVSSLPLNAAEEITPPTTTWSLTSETAWKAYDARPGRSNVSALWNPYTSITATGGFMERNDYFHDTDSITNDEGTLPIAPAETLSEDDVQLLRLQRAFDIPPRAVRESLVDTFMKRCAPWMPIVERSWLQDIDNSKPSILLLQAAFLAASRVTSAPAVASYASSHEFYRRAKALFYSGWEKNPLTVVAAVCILHWYNPECPEHVSTNTSGFWRYVGIGLAHQIGLHKEPLNTEGKALRRRLWWSLFARDCLISAGQGRPLAVNLCDSELAPPRIDDFRDSSHRPNLFISYVEICSILGHLTQCCRRDSLTRRTRQSIGKSLQRWIHGLPKSLRLFASTGSDTELSSAEKPLSPYDFEARQLHVPYFVCLIILSRSQPAHHAPSAAAILAAAYIVAIFEDFLARDEIQYLGSVFTFYLLATGIGMLSCRRIPLLWSKAAPGMQTIDSSLEQLAKRWPSAMAPLRVLRTITEKQQSLPTADSHVEAPSLQDEHRAFFDTLGPGLTWAWEDLMRPRMYQDGAEAEYTGSIGYRVSEGPIPPVSSRTRGNAAAIVDTLPTGSLFDPVNDFPELNNQDPLDHGLFQLQYDGIGDWLLNDYDTYGDIMI